MSNDIEINDLLVWDSDECAGEWHGHIALWKSFASLGQIEVTSIPSLVDKNADELRTRYLAWLYDFGEAKLGNKRIVDYLELRPGFSYWWMTLPSLVSFGGATPVYNAVRLLALEGLARELGCKAITLVSDNHVLAEAIRKWCGNAGLGFQWRRIGAKTKPTDFATQVLRALSYPLQGLIYLLHHTIQRWPLRRSAETLDKNSQGVVTFVDYLIHLKPEDISLGKFGSNYWTNLIKILDGYVIKTNWLHHYVPHALIQSTQQAKNVIDKFNQSATGLQSHATLDGALNFSVIWNAVRDYVRILANGIMLRSIRLHFTPKESDVDFGPLMREEWRNCMFGQAAISNCLFLNKFEFLLKRMPRQKLGIYLQENQPWEMAFIYAWKSVGHGRLLGVPHTTVLFWDTRYHFDPRSYQRKGNDLPMPYQVALNGPASLERYRDGGYPEDQMVEVEALRYLYLENKPLEFCSNKGDTTKALRVLVLGDYFPDVTRHQMELLLAAACDMPLDTCYIIRPHPSCAIKASNYPSFQTHITSAPLAELLRGCDVAFTSNTTSAAVDAYCFGVPVVSMLDGNSFNMSPLRGMKGVVYVTSPDELVTALNNAKQRERVLAEPYFCLDNALPRWRKLLGRSLEATEKAIGI